MRTLTIAGVLALALTTMLASPARAGGTVVDLDGMRSKTPSSWVEVATRAPRYKHFKLSRSTKTKADTDLLVFYFGPGRGGDVSSNIARWKSIFEPPRGKSINQVTKVKRFKVGDATITTVELRGTYLYRRRPVDPLITAERRANHRMIGVIVESANGPYFMRMVGPRKTINAHVAGFYRWLKKFR